MQLDQIKRRDFITLLGGAAAAWPLTARAQQTARVSRVGIVDDAPMGQSFRQALREFGYIEGESVNYEYRYSEGVTAAGAHRFSTLGFGRMIERAAQSLSLFGNSEKHCTAIGNRLYHPQFGYGRREIACDRRGL